jgi:hypothetical protein
VTTFPRGKGWRDMWAAEPVGIQTDGLAKPLPHAVAARCGTDGFLYISRPKARVLELIVMPRGDYHNYDYTLFYMNVRRNVEDRLAAFLKQRQQVSPPRTT